MFKMPWRSAIVALLLMLAATAAASGPARPVPDVPTQAPHPRRQLRSTLAAPPLAAAATRAAQRDWLDAAEAVPAPELYYRDLDDGRTQYIWRHDDTLPRDALAGRPEVWLAAELDADADGALLAHFLEHYSRLGIHRDRMLLTLRSAGGRASPALLKARAALGAFGADVRLWLGRPSLEGGLQAALLAALRVPIKDWIVVARGHEFVDFGGATAREYLEDRELEGATWASGLAAERVAAGGAFAAAPPPGAPLAARFPLACNLSAAPEPPHTAVVAIRGFLRHGAHRRSALPAEEAGGYLAASAPGEDSLRGTGACGGGDLLPLTPYHRWWPYYRTDTVVGNAYLWGEREADPPEGLPTVHRFRWHAGAATAVSAAERRPCEAAPSEADAAWEAAAARGRAAIGGGGDLRCVESADAIGSGERRLPLNREAAAALARARRAFESNGI